MYKPGNLAWSSYCYFIFYQKLLQWNLCIFCRSIGHPMVPAVCHWSFTTEDEVCSKSVHMGFVVALGHFFFTYFNYPLLVSFHCCSIFIFHS